MATTKIADIIKPEHFAPYVIERTTELSRLFTSGIVAPVPQLNIMGQEGGTILNMPFWNDLSGRSQVLSDTVPLVVKKITTGRDVAVLHARADAWGANDLAEALSGDDPMGAIADLVADYWNRDFQATLISTLEGAMRNADMAANVLDVSAVLNGQMITSDVILDATQKLGDAKQQLTAIIMHSMTENVLVKQQLIEYALDAEGRPTLPMYMGKDVIVDDSMPVTNGVFTTYLFGRGAIGYGEGNPPVPVETGRDILQGDNILVNRKHFVLHPRGIAWKGAPAGVSPTNEELAAAGNWERRFHQKHIRVVAVKHRLANAAS
jgi:hypothetical protein